MLSFENEDNVSPWQELLLHDPQTNGSILAIVSSDSIPVLATTLEANGSQLHVIGRICGDSYRWKEANIDE